MPPKKRYRPSRSQKKRDSTALQRMGEELTTLGSSVLAKMPLTPNIREAVLEWQRLSSHEGRRRQMQYIGRLMREEADPQAVRDALDAIKLGHTGETASFKRSEKLRDDLMNATDAEMDTLLAAFSAEDATATSRQRPATNANTAVLRTPIGHCSASSKASRPNNDP